MRTLEFRAYDSTTGKVSEPFDVKESWGDYLIDFEDYSTDGALDSLIWEQFTGLLDRNGQKIYEGDIVLDYYDGDDAFIVEWDEDTASFILTDTEHILNVSFDIFCPDKDLEIVGNIHENKEILETKNEIREN